MANSIPLPHIEHRIKQLVNCISYGVIVFSILIMIIWIMNPRLLTILIPQSATIKFNTALLFLLCTFCVSPVSQNSYLLKRWFNHILLVIMTISGITFLASLFSTPLFLDQLIVPDPLTSPDAQPGQMSEMTSLLFLLMGIAIMCSEHRTLIAEQIAVFVNLIALVAVFAFFFDFESLYAINFFSTVSLFTGFLFLLISMVFILSLPNGVISSLVKENNPAGITTRRLLPTVLLLPVLLGWIFQQGTNAGLYQPAFALVLMTITTVSLQLAMGIMHTTALQRWYYKNKEVQQELIDHEIERIELEHVRSNNTLKEQFLAQLSHDMRTPISRIILSSDIITQFDDRITDAQRINHLKKIRYQSLSMLDFVDDLVILSQLEFDKIPFDPETDNLVQFCQEYYDEFIEYSDLVDHNFIISVPDDAIYLDFDKKLMRRMLSNLVGNAIKYSPDGGNIILRIKADNICTELSIQDEGIGIPKNNIDTLYNLFMRADNVDHISGYGLGLSIVKKAVDAHQAIISVNSKIGHGSTFTVKFKNKIRFT